MFNIILLKFEYEYLKFLNYKNQCCLNYCSPPARFKKFTYKSLCLIRKSLFLL